MLAAVFSYYLLPVMSRRAWRQAWSRSRCSRRPSSTRGSMRRRYSSMQTERDVISFRFFTAEVLNSNLLPHLRRHQLVAQRLGFQTHADKFFLFESVKLFICKLGWNHVKDLVNIEQKTSQKVAFKFFAILCISCQLANVSILKFDIEHVKHIVFHFHC